MTRTAGTLRRLLERLPERDGAQPLPVVVGRRIRRLSRPAGIRHRRVQQHRRGRVAAVDGGGVDERLERGTELPGGLHRAVELAALEPVAAHHGHDFAGAVLDGEQGALDGGFLFQSSSVSSPAASALHHARFDEVADLHQLRRRLPRPGEALAADLGVRRCRRARECSSARPPRPPRDDVAVRDGLLPARIAEAVERALFREHVALRRPPAAPLVEPAQAVVDGRIGGCLQSHVEGRADAESVLVELLRAEVRLDVLPHLLDEVRRDGVGRRRKPAVTIGVSSRRVGVRLGDVADSRHARQGVVAPAQRVLHVDVGALAARGLDDAGDQRRLLHGQVLRALVEVDARGGLDAVRAVPEVDLVRVEREDLGFRVALLDLDGEQRLADLPLPGLLRRQEQVARELLRQRAGAAGLALLHEVAEQRDDDARDAEADVLLEPLVLGRHDRLPQASGRSGRR